MDKVKIIYLIENAQNILKEKPENWVDDFESILDKIIEELDMKTILNRGPKDALDELIIKAITDLRAAVHR